MNCFCSVKFHWSNSGGYTINSVVHNGSNSHGRTSKYEAGKPHETKTPFLSFFAISKMNHKRLLSTTGNKTVVARQAAVKVQSTGEVDRQGEAHQQNQHSSHEIRPPLWRVSRRERDIIWQFGNEVIYRGVRWDRTSTGHAN